LTLKEPPAQSFPLIFKNLPEVRANFHIVTEWKREDYGKARKCGFRTMPITHSRVIPISLIRFAGRVIIFSPES
jgi:hypothetical protein